SHPGEEREETRSLASCVHTALGFFSRMAIRAAPTIAAVKSRPMTSRGSTYLSISVAPISLTVTVGGRGVDCFKIALDKTAPTRLPKVTSDTAMPIHQDQGEGLLSSGGGEGEDPVAFAGFMLGASGAWVLSTNGRTGE